MAIANANYRKASAGMGEDEGLAFHKVFGYKDAVWKDKRFSISFISVFWLPEVRKLLFAGAFKLGADYISFALIGVTSTLNNPDEQVNHSFTPYFYGSCLAILISGIFHDTIFQKKAYLLIVVLNLITILW